jgi:hypothetical protein
LKNTSIKTKPTNHPEVLTVLSKKDQVVEIAASILSRRIDRGFTFGKTLESILPLLGGEGRGEGGRFLS